MSGDTSPFTSGDDLPQNNDGGASTLTHDVRPQMVDLGHTREFLGYLDPETEKFTFQTFSDNADRKDPSLTRQLHGTLEEHAQELADLNARGAGVFVTLNRTDLLGRKKENICAVRALVAELDDAPPEPLHDWLPASIAVNSSPGKHHIYYLVRDLPLDDFSPLQKQLAAAFGGDPAVHDLPRVLRLPGFYHQKVNAAKGLRGKPHMVHAVWEDSRAPYSASFLKQKITELQTRRPIKINTGTANWAGEEMAALAEVEEALTYISPDGPYDEWLNVLIALHNHFGAAGEALAEAWSAKSEKHRPDDISKRWKGFREGGTVTIATVLDLAKRGGCDLAELRAKHRPPNERHVENHACAGVGGATEDAEDAIDVACEGPQPLLRPARPGQPFPVDALGPLANVVRAVQGTTLAPIEIPAASALSVAALAVQGLADVETLGGPRPTSLYLLTIAQSGERKSSCDSLLMSPLREIEKSEAADHRIEMAEWVTDHLLWKDEQDRLRAEIKRASGQEKADGQKAVQALTEPKRPPSRDRTVTEPTFEGLTRKFAEGLPTLGIFSDEGGQFLGGAAMSSDNRQKTQAALNDLWQGNPIRRTRQGDGSITLMGRRLSMHLMVQPVVVRGFMSDTLAAETGFLPRFLISDPASTIGTRLHHRQKLDDEALRAYGEQLFRVLQRQLPMDEDTNALSPRLLKLSDGAWKMLVAFSDAIEVRQGPGMELAHVTGYASKAAEQAARIAGVLTMFADPDAQVVSEEAVANGIALAQFYLSEAVRLTDAAGGNEEIRNAEALRVWLVHTWEHDVVIPSEILQFGPNRLRDRASIKKALAVLVEAGWVTPLPGGTVVRGSARKEPYLIVGPRDVV